MNDKKLKAVHSGEGRIKDMVTETISNIGFSFPDGEQVEHLDIKGYSLNGPYLVVQLKDDTQFIYHMGNTKCIKIWITKVE